MTFRVRGVRVGVNMTAGKDSVVFVVVDFSLIGSKVT